MVTIKEVILQLELLPWRPGLDDLALLQGAVEDSV